MNSKLKWALGVFVITLLATGTTVVAAPAMFQKSSEQVDGCIERARAGLERDPVSCAREANRWLSLPRMLPWSRNRTALETHSNLRRAAVCALKTSSAMFPNAARRHEATQILASGASKKDRSDIRQAGAIHEAALACEEVQMGAAVDGACFWDHRARLMPTMLRGHGKRALGIGRWLEERRARASGSAVVSYTVGCDLQLGAALCLLGDSKAGQANLSDSRCGDNRRSAPGRTVAQKLGLQACGGAAAKNLHSALFDVMRGRDKLVHAKLGECCSQRNPARLPFAAAAIVRDTPTAATAMRYLLGDKESVAPLLDLHDAFLNPFIAPALPSFRVFPDDDSTYLVPLGLYEQAAEKLDALASETTEPIDDETLDTRATSNPRGFFQQVAWIMRIYATSEALHRHDIKRAKKLLLAPTPIASPWSVVRLHLLLQAGAVKEVLAFASAFDQSSNSVERALVEVYRALALLPLGRDADALAALEAAEQHAAKKPKLWELGGQVLPAEYGMSRVAWLHAALAWRMGKPATGANMTAPMSADGLRLGDPLSRWWAALNSNGDARRQARPELRLLTLNTRGFVKLGELCDDVTPFQMYLVGELARGDGDIEVWLDRIFDNVMYNGRCGLRARANAARWRGDAAAAADWQQRASRIDRLIVDDNTALLAALARL